MVTREAVLPAKSSVTKYLNPTVEARVRGQGLSLRFTDLNDTPSYMINIAVKQFKNLVKPHMKHSKRKQSSKIYTQR